MAGHSLFSNLFALSSGVITFIVIGIAVVVLSLWAVTTFNGLIRKRQSCKESWSDIDTELKRRHDLIPNLVSTVKGYVAHERGVLEEVTKLRDEAMQAQNQRPANRGKVEGQLGVSVDKLVARAEAYPDLKANQNMMQVQEELTTTENKVAFSRQAYNDSVMHFNNGREQFPSNIIAGMFNFQEAAMWEVESEAAKAAPKVDFGA